MRRLSRALLLLGAFAGLAAVAPRRVAAQAVEDPDALIRQGVERRQLGDNQGAYRLFMRAYNVRRTARAAAQLGTCEFEIGLWVESEAHITEALRASNDRWIQQHWDELGDLMGRLRQVLGRLEVVGRPAGAEVEVAGRSVGRLPLEGPLRMVRGEVAVRVTAPGFQPYQRSVNVVANELAQVVVELDRADGRVATLPPARTGTPYPPPGGHGGSSSNPVLDVGPVDSDWRVPAGWASAGVAALLGAGAGASWAVYYVNAKRFNDFRDAPFTADKRCNQGAVRAAGGGPCADWLSTAQTAKTLTIAGGVGAGAAAIAAVIFFSTASPNGEKRVQRSWNLACAPGAGLGAACAVSF
jgi:hypothetical protein